MRDNEVSGSGSSVNPEIDVVLYIEISRKLMVLSFSPSILTL